MKIFISTLLLLVLTISSQAIASEVNLINKDQLKDQIGANNLIILDVRSGRDWNSSKMKIVGAIREEPGNIEAWASNYDQEKTIVLYCA